MGRLAFIAGRPVQAFNLKGFIMSQVAIGPEFFAKALNDYSDWEWALIREFLQNSVDCGSKNIYVEVTLKDGDTVLTVENDGKSMTEDILVGKLLSLGSSGKDFQGESVGGFGKAKEILYFCHKHYTIRSGSLQVDGSGAQYELKRGQKQKGTLSRIVLAGDHKEELEDQVRRFCKLAQVKPAIFLNGTGVAPFHKLIKGSRRRELDFGVVYTNRQLSNVVVVRVGGIPMFTCYTDHKGCVVLELSTSKVLTSNRDGMRYGERRELEAFITDLTVNKRKALTPRDTEYHRFDGAELSHAAEQKLDVAALVENAEERMGVLEGKPSYGGDTVTDHGTALENQLGHRFIVKNETQKNVPASFMPDSDDFGKYGSRLATIWARLMLTMHKVFDRDGTFTIGFIFSDEAAAQHEYSNQDGTVYFINPVDSEGRKRYSYSPRKAKKDQNLLKLIALHEFIHGLGYSNHDEEYAAKLTYMAAELLNHDKEFKWCFEAK